MRAYEQYEIFQELLGTGVPPAFGVFATRQMRRPDGSYVIIRSFKVAAEDWSLGAEEEKSRVFAAWLAQREAVQQGALNLAPLPLLEHEAAQAGKDQEVWYERPWYSMSLLQVIQVGATLNHEQLLQIILGIVSGLIELQSLGENPRAHGRLHLGNVLLGEGEGVPDFATAPVVLTDPLPVNPKEPFTDEKSDLRSVGRIIFQLVNQNEGLHFPAGEIPDSDNWAGLGDKEGAIWRRICARLLTPSAFPEPYTLASLAAELRRWRRGRVMPEWVGPAAISLAALLACGAGVFFAYRSLPWHVSVSGPPGPVEEDEQVQLRAKGFGLWTVGPENYQWKSNDVVIGGAPGPQLTVSAAATFAVQVSVSNAQHAVTSESFTVKVKEAQAPRIIKINSAVQVPPESQTNLTVEATGTEPLRYQWYFRGTLLTNGGASLSLFITDESQAGAYHVVVSNKKGSVSNDFQVTLAPKLPAKTTPAPAPIPKPIAITPTVLKTNLSAQPVTRMTNKPAILSKLNRKTIKTGDPVNLDVDISGDPPIHYEFKKDGKPVNGNSGDLTNRLQVELRLGKVKPDQRGDYFLSLMNAAGSVDDKVMELKVCEPPKVNRSNELVSVIEGTAHTFNAGASGSELTYKWLYGSRLTPETGDSYKIKDATTNNAGQYSVIVSNSCGMATNSWTLAVTPFPSQATPPKALTNYLDMVFIWSEKAQLYVGQTEVSRKQYMDVMGTNHEEWNKGKDKSLDLPANCISVEEAKAFCALAKKPPRFEKWIYRLPKAKEWSDFSGIEPDTKSSKLPERFPLDDQIVSRPKMPAIRTPATVGRSRTNSLPSEIYDLIGNVCEISEEGDLLGWSFLEIPRLDKGGHKAVEPLKAEPRPRDCSEIGFRVVLDGKRRSP